MKTDQLKTDTRKLDYLNRIMISLFARIDLIYYQTLNKPFCRLNKLNIQTPLACRRVYCY